MKILVVTQYYDPEPVPKLHLLASRLASRGHNVTVLTGAPCYPLGKVFQGYSNSFFREVKDGVEILRAPQFPDHSRRAFKRMLYYFAFPLASLRYIPELKKQRFDIIYMYGAAIPVLSLAALFKKLFKARIVFDVVDLWPETAEASGMMKSKMALKLLAWLSKKIYQSADHLGVVTRGFKERFVQRGISPEKITVTYYAAPDVRLPSSIGRLSESFIITFTGNIGPYQDLDTLLTVAKKAEHEGLKLQFHIVGDGTELNRLMEIAQKEQLRSVFFFGRRPAEEMAGFYSKADALLVTLKPDCLSVVSIPSKTYSYLAAGKPVIMAVDGEASNFTTQNNFGIAVKASDPDDLFNAIKRLIDMSPDWRARLGLNARHVYEANFSENKHVIVWENLLKSLSEKS